MKHLVLYTMEGCHFCGQFKEILKLIQAGKDAEAMEKLRLALADPKIKAEILEKLQQQ